MLSRIAKSAAAQWDQVFNIRQEWQDAVSSVEAAEWMLDCAKGTPMESSMLEVLEQAKETERKAYARLQSISSEARSLSHHYSDKLVKGE